MQTVQTGAELPDFPFPGPQRSDVPYYEWHSPGDSITIRLSLDTVRRLDPVVLEGFRALRTRGLEVGGLLLGRFTPGHKRITIIEDFEPVDSEHRSGPSYTLSEKDKNLLENRLAARISKRGLRVVGYWRSHTRGGLFLDREDSAAMRTYFADPSQVMLVVRPSAGEPSMGAFWFWEDGELRRESPYQVFPSNAERLLAGPFGILNAANPTEIGDRGPAPLAGARQGLATAAAPAPARVVQAPAAAEDRVSATAVLDQTAVEPAVRHVWLGPLQRRFALAAVLTTLLIASAPVVYRIWRSAGPHPSTPSEPSASSELSLKVSQETGKGLRLSWDRDSPAVRSAVRGVLLITDTGSLVRLDLDKKLLSEGSIVYFPKGEDIDFRLAVSANGRGINESVRAVMPVSTAPKPALESSAAALQVEQSAPRAERPTNPAESRSQETAGTRRSSASPQPGDFVAKAPAKPYKPPTPNATEGSAARTPVLALGRPPALVPSPAPDLVAQPLYAVATVTYEPMGPSALQRAVHKIPGLRWLDRFPASDNNSFVPPRPKNEISFLAPTTSGRDVLERTPIDLKISLDESGRISQAQLLPDSKNNPVASLAIRASLTWQFIPAAWRGKAVASELIVRLAFGGDSRSATTRTPLPSSTSAASQD